MTDLRVALSDLPGFDPVGLNLGRHDEWSACVACGHVDSTVLIVRGVGTRHVVAEWWPTAGFELDLSNAATRDRLARWLVARVGIPVGCTAPEWSTDPDGWSIFAGESPECSGLACWDLQGRGAGAASGTVGGLADLDPTDDTRLPDGSSQVDCIALGRVAVHLGRSDG